MATSKLGLINDPVPIRGGVPYGGGRGILTRREMEKVKQLLSNARGEKLFNVDLTKDDDVWVAFVSLSRGGYIRARDTNSLNFILTDKGRTYLEQLTST